MRESFGNFLLENWGGSPKHKVNFDLEALDFWLNHGNQKVRVDVHRSNILKFNQYEVSLSDVLRAGNSGENIDNIVLLGLIGSGESKVIRKLGGISFGKVKFKPLTFLGKVSSENRNGEFDPFNGEVFVNTNLDHIKLADTIVHEAQHRAFSIISSIPELKNMMPKDLLVGDFKDGWGHSNSGWPIVNGLQINPEHALIYSSGRLGSSKNRLKMKVFIEGDSSGRLMAGYDDIAKAILYWRNLYREIDIAVGVYLRSRIGHRDTGSRGRRRVSDYEKKLNDALKPKLISITDDIEALTRSEDYSQGRHRTNAIFGDEATSKLEKENPIVTKTVKTSKPKHTYLDVGDVGTEKNEKTNLIASTAMGLGLIAIIFGGIYGYRKWRDRRDVLSHKLSRDIKNNKKKRVAVSEFRTRYRKEIKMAKDDPALAGKLAKELEVILDNL